MTQKIDDNFVKIAKCRFCGNETKVILLHKRLKAIPDNQAFSPEPCDKCKKRVKDHKYFIGECGHSGFIKVSALKKVVKPEEFKKLKDHKIFRTDKCFMCLGFIKEKDVNKI